MSDDDICVLWVHTTCLTMIDFLILGFQKISRNWQAPARLIVEDVKVGAAGDDTMMH